VFEQGPQRLELGGLDEVLVEAHFLCTAAILVLTPPGEGDQ
jgi:hypothetical protein